MKCVAMPPEGDIVVALLSSVHGALDCIAIVVDHKNDDVKVFLGDGADS